MINLEYDDNIYNIYDKFLSAAKQRNFTLSSKT